MLGVIVLHVVAPCCTTDKVWIFFFTFRFKIREDLLQNRNTADAQDPVRIELRLRIPDDPFFRFFRSVARF